ncbi:MAG: phosphoribosylglycinamide formyltransferase [Candidatus Micrarchaeota archaeon]
MPKLKIAILASGRGSNFEEIAKAVKNGEINAEIKVMITNRPEAGAVSIAKEYKIPCEIIERKNFAKRTQFDLKLKEILDSYKVDLVVLAGYMLLIKSKELLEKYKNRIINIHPSLLPKYPGEDAQEQAFKAGEKISGLTIHFVDAGLDSGPIILQKEVDISDCKNADEVTQKILNEEHKQYKKIIDNFSKGEYKIINGKVSSLRRD